MSKKITNIAYKKCIEDIIKVINLKFPYTHVKLDEFISHNKFYSSIVIKHISGKNYMYLDSHVMNCSSYKKLFLNFLKFLSDSPVSSLKCFGLTYYEARMTCDMMLS